MTQTPFVFLLQSPFLFRAWSLELLHPHAASYRIRPNVCMTYCTMTLGSELLHGTLIHLLCMDIVHLYQESSWHPLKTAYPISRTQGKPLIGQLLVQPCVACHCVASLLHRYSCALPHSQHRVAASRDHEYPRFQGDDSDSQSPERPGSKDNVRVLCCRAFNFGKLTKAWRTTPTLFPHLAPIGSGALPALMTR